MFKNETPHCARNFFYLHVWQELINVFVQIVTSVYNNNNNTDTHVIIKCIYGAYICNKYGPEINHAYLQIWPWDKPCIPINMALR